MTKPSKQGKVLIEKSKVEHLRQLNAKQHGMLQDMQTKLHWMRSSLIEVFRQVNFYINPDTGEPDVAGLRQFVIKCTEPSTEGDDSNGSTGETEGSREGDGLENIEGVGDVRSEGTGVSNEDAATGHSEDGGEEGDTR